MNRREVLRAGLTGFSALSLAGLYQLYGERIAFYRANPPDPDWDGVFVAETK